ncbi:BES1/BZR1 homolog protein 4-like [Phalaenopsis equestris]|uniref:BES1/BZR1 homolog protein 4-like n=1 Tax=Phalaenopsis equestris TaxID=78828 RepID=UPI0009E5FA50|nr:BES1/BZR1 homolog protein 4-like [Phalaenopsis equestris]
MTSATRLPTWKERENNKRRERRRRAIAAKIYSGLRTYGNYKLPKHCDNNEVLKALCNEAGWTVEADGTTYRKGCKPAELLEITRASQCSSYQPSPTSSSFPSPASSPFLSPPNFPMVTADPNSLIPWLKNLSSTSTTSSPCSSKSPSLHNLFIHHGSLSAPVTPPLSSPTARTPRIKTDWDDPATNFQPSWPPSPTFSLVFPTPFGLYREGVGSGGSSRMWTPGQSGMCSPVNVGTDVPMMDVAIATEEFAFGSCGSGGNGNYMMVKPWEGETIHEECGADELELTLGSSRTRV